MKRLWADPEWRERQLERKIEGQTRAAYEGRVGGAKLKSGVTRKSRNGHHVQITLRVDPEVFAEVKAVATKQNKPLTEILRTYVEWGLEQEKL